MSLQGGICREIVFKYIPNTRTRIKLFIIEAKVIANNIANVDTPNFQAKDVQFRTEFQQALQAYRTDPRHFEFKGSTNKFS